MSADNLMVALCCLAMVALFFKRGSVDALNEIIENLVNNFRGGPPTPMHPSPANDSALLRARRRRITNWHL
jgi:hypothetical protein